MSENQRRKQKINLSKLTMNKYRLKEKKKKKERQVLDLMTKKNKMKKVKDTDN